MPPLPPPPQPAAPPDDGVSFNTFSGLKNTVAPESLTAREMTRAQNVDLDDLGQIHRRRGRRQVADGSWSAIFVTKSPFVQTFGVRNGQLVMIRPDYYRYTLGDGYATDPIAWVQVGPVLYFSSIHNSGQIDLASLTVTPWCRVVSPAYQPGFAQAAASDWWFSPVVRPEDGLGAVGGKLLGPPPLGSFLAYYNGRIYIAAGSTLWATELFLYNFVDKNKGYRQFESPITGLQAVEDGVYVGTMDGLYFLKGAYSDHVRTLRERSAVVPGSMVEAPGELVDPEGRRFPDKPQQTQRAMACMTDDGVVVGLAGGQTFNLTRTNFVFPRAERAAALFRVEDGMGTYVIPQDSGGTPTDNAKFGDYLSATVTPASVPGLSLEDLGLIPTGSGTSPPSGGSGSGGGSGGGSSGGTSNMEALTFVVVGASSYNATHNFDYQPDVWAVDNNNEPVEVDYTYVTGAVHFTFGTPFYGTLYLA